VAGGQVFICTLAIVNRQETPAMLSPTNPRDAKACQNCSNSTCCRKYGSPEGLVIFILSRSLSRYHELIIGNEILDRVRIKTAPLNKKL